MNEQDILKIETETLHDIIDQLNYYQMLCLDADCVKSDITEAYKYYSSRYHPDRLPTDDANLQNKSKYLQLSFKEASDTLLSMGGRMSYDVLLASGKIRIEDTQLAQTQDQNANDVSNAAETENGKKYWMLALQAFESKDFSSAILQISFALQYEPQNSVFLEWQEMAKDTAKKAPKENNNPYKIRL
jgi:DnaJ-class molecular chaperone